MVSGSIAQAPPSEPIGTRDIDSTPPANTRSSQPEATFWAATLTASRPEAQKRLSCTPATVSGRPGLDRRGLGDVRALVADRRDAAEHDVVDARGVEFLVADERLVHQADDEVDRLGAVQRAVELALAARRADRVEHQRLCGCHLWDLLGRRPAVRAGVAVVARANATTETFMHERK